MEKKNKTKKCHQTFCRRLNLLTRRNLTIMNVSEKLKKKMEKKDLKSCKKNYCSLGCKKTGHSKNIKNNFYKKVDVKTLKSLGALSACVPFTKPFISGTPSETKKGWKILKDFP
jgi:SOS response regulatory protein OraA/RecX